MPDVTPHDPPPPRRSAFEWSLSALRPADADVARPSFMYTAGQASRDKAVRFWRWVAGGCVTLAVGVAGVSVGIVADERGRKVEVRTPAVVPPSLLPTADPEPPPLHPPMPYAVPPAVAVAPATSTPTEIAAALERRRNILVGGLGLIPEVKRPAVPSSDPPFTLTSGVFGVPTSPKPADPR